jgi:hypothetical protein
VSPLKEKEYDMNMIAKIKTHPQVFAGICLAVIATIAVVCILIASASEAEASDQAPDGAIAQTFDATGPTGDAYKPDANASGDDAGGLQIKQEGSDLLYSSDGGKTWTKEAPADSGMSVGVQEMPKGYNPE